MRLLVLTCLLFTTPLAAQPAAFDPAEWMLVIEDDFQRAELGDAWHVDGVSRIESGRLIFGERAPSRLVFTQPVGSDVRVEFQGEALPHLPPCDLSVILACPAPPEGQWGHLLAFGGVANTAWQIVGGGVERARIDNPPKLIEHGRTYHVAGTREGRALWLEVDGELLLETTGEDPVTGPDYAHAGVLTWHGMYLDWIRIYKRTTPHPDTPEYIDSLPGLALALDEDRVLSALRDHDNPDLQTALALFNDGKPQEAEQVFLTLDDPELRAAGVAYCLGHLYYDAPLQDMIRGGDLLIELAENNPDDERLAAYAELGRRMHGLSDLRLDGGPNVSLAIGKTLQMGFAGNPLYDQAHLYSLRLQRAGAQEAGMSKAGLVDAFEALKRHYPLHQGLRELTGERIPWGEDLIDDSDAPGWARYGRELYARQCRVLEWWFNQRQQPDGQLGAGYGDDVEILRDWGPIAVISTGAPHLVEGIERLSEGAWQDDLTEWGFAGYWDVQHSAEPSADTLPTMMILRWGDPLWIERNMRSAKTIRDIYMGTDANGYYRFKSAWFGHDVVGQLPTLGGDTHYCVRAMKHLQHLALYGNQEARRVYLNWVDGWLNATMSEYPEKPEGYIPSSLFYPDGGIIPPGYDSHLVERVHFMDNFPGMGTMMLGTFLAGHFLTGERQYLEPARYFLERTSYGPLLRGDHERGSREWRRMSQQYSGDPNVMTSYRWMTGDRASDEYITRFASPYQRYFVTNDLDALIASIEGAAKSLRHNFALLTRELLQTDRAGLPGADATLGAYTGGLHTWRDALLPTMAVTWDAPSTDFAALVVVRAPDRLRTWVYSFHDEPIELGMRAWHLVPGEYRVVHGAIHPGEDGHNMRYGWGEPSTHVHRRPLDTCAITVPPRTAYCIDLRLLEPIEVPALAPDLAIADRDVELLDDGSVRVSVHNVGSAPAREVQVALQVRQGEAWNEVARQATGVLPAPEFDPVVETLTFADPPRAHAYRVVLDPQGEVEELYLGNNTAVAGPR